ncbi:MAG: hypothetical protein ACM3X0_13475 [Bacteroidota bacterium]
MPHGSLHGLLERPDLPRGLILLVRAHHAPADTIITTHLVSCGYAVFGVELLTSQEAHFADATQNVPRLSQRLIDILDLIRHDGDMQDLPLAVFANGDTAPAAIRAAAQRDTQIKALACHGGLVDRAGLQALNLLVAPLLMIFDADDAIGQAAFQRAASHLGCRHQTHVLELGEDPVMPATGWFVRQLGS